MLTVQERIKQSPNTTLKYTLSSPKASETGILGGGGEGYLPPRLGQSEAHLLRDKPSAVYASNMAKSNRAPLSHSPHRISDNLQVIQLPNGRKEKSGASSPAGSAKAGPRPHVQAGGNLVYRFPTSRYLGSSASPAS